MLFAIPIFLFVVICVCIALAIFSKFDEDILIAIIVGSIISIFISLVPIFEYYSCPKCDKVSTSNYCKYCGTEIHGGRRKINCPNCNAICHASDDYCGNCGCMLKENVDNN